VVGFGFGSYYEHANACGGVGAVVYLLLSEIVRFIERIIVEKLNSIKYLIPLSYFEVRRSVDEWD